MTATRRVSVRSTALVIAATVVACSESSRRPVSPIGPGTPAPVVVTRLELEGPGTVHLGQTVQFTVTAYQSDGTTRDATRDVTWRSFNPSLLSMAAPGQFTGKAKGTTSVSVAWAGRTAFIGEVIIVPEGTFRLLGTVRDSGVAVEAVVRIEDQAIGHTDVPTAGGQYVVYGIAGDTRVTVMKNGYEQETKRQVIRSHQRIDFDLALSRPRSDVTGRYTLTVTAAPACPSLPANVQSRSYSAMVEQSGPALTVTLSGSQFVTGGGRTRNRFSGFMEADRAVFRLASMVDTYYYYYYIFVLPDVFEQLETNSFFAFDGTAVAALEADRLSGTLDGLLSTVSGPPYRFGVRCRSANHRFVLTRTTS